MVGTGVNFGTFWSRNRKGGNKLVDCLVMLRVVVTEDDILVGRVDVGYVSLLEDRLGFPFEGEDGNDFEIAPYEWAELGGE